MNGSKNARNVGSIVHLNQGGGNSKQGLPSTIGIPSAIVAMYRERIGYCCLTKNKLLPKVNISWKGTVGMVGIHR